MNIEELRATNWIIFEAIVGSHAYGLNTPTSDIDYKGVFIQPLDSILGMGYIEQISDDKNDTTFYELKRFMELVATNNPNILELLGMPADMIVYQHPIYTMILDHQMEFLTKACKNSFAGYAIAQIKKARGLNKKIVNPIDKKRKSPLHFTYVPLPSGGSRPFLEWFEYYQMENAEEKLVEATKKIGLAAVPNARDLYHVYFSDTHTYRGMINDDLTSNELRLTSIPKGEIPLTVVSYNKDGYTKYCKDYKEYWEWVANRNQARYNDNAQHGKGYDGKNLAHCHRLLDMAIEIAQGQGIIVRRPNREFLLDIRYGTMDYDELVTAAEAKIELADTLYDNSLLPDRVDAEFVDELLIRMRREYYGLDWKRSFGSFFFRAIFRILKSNEKILTMYISTPLIQKFDQIIANDLASFATLPMAEKEAFVNYYFLTQQGSPLTPVVKPNIFAVAKDKAVSKQNFMLSLSRVNGHSMAEFIKLVGPFTQKLHLGGPAVNHTYNKRNWAISLRVIEGHLRLIVLETGRGQAFHIFGWSSADLNTKISESEMKRALSQGRVSVKFQISHKNDNGRYIPDFNHGTIIYIA